MAENSNTPTTHDVQPKYEKDILKLPSWFQGTMEEYLGLLDQYHGAEELKDLVYEKLRAGFSIKDIVNVLEGA